MGDIPGEGFGAVVDTEGGLSGVTDLEPDDQDLDDEFEDDVDDDEDELDEADGDGDDIDDEADGDVDDEEGSGEGAEDEDGLNLLEQEGEIAADYIEGLLDIADLDGDIDMDVEGDRAVVSVVGATLDELVGDEGEVLEALQELTRLAVHRQTGVRARLMLDVGGFRARRRFELADLGRSVAAEVARSGEPRSSRPCPRSSGRSSTTPWLMLDYAASRRARSRTGGSWSSRPAEVATVTEAGLPPPAVAAEVFGEALKKASEFASLLATEGVTRGLIGPRETSRLWDRHLLNCAVVAELLPDSGQLVDIGSGAGLPGIVLALMKPNLDVVLLEPMLRRVAFLEECVGALGMENASVVRGRAEEFSGKIQADVATARAVAPMEKLAGWASGLLRQGGTILAIKGQSADGGSKGGPAHFVAARRAFHRGPARGAR